ncbi:hypothetical protein TWF281_007554 [Arthrobotrys megalospora]
MAQLPYEISNAIFANLSRRDLWALSLTNRRWHDLVSPKLYETIVIGLRDGVSLSPGFIRSFAFGSQHSHLRLIQNVILLVDPKYCYTGDEGNKWKTSAITMIHELLYAFLLKLGDGQLRRFIWSSGLDIDERIFILLANHHGSTLECLYIDTDPKAGRLNEEEISNFSKFSSLRTLRWKGFESLEYNVALARMLKASARSLKTISIGHLYPNEHFSGGEGIFRKHAVDLELPALSECQMSMCVYFARGDSDKPIGSLVLDSIARSSRVQRLCTETSLSSLAKYPFKFNGLVELDIRLSGEFRYKDAIFHHGPTLKVLSLRTRTPDFYGGSKPISDEELLEIGYKCPNLVELGISQEFSIRDRTSWRSISGPQMSFTKIPLHVFRNLELVVIMIKYITNDDLFNNKAFRKNANGQVGETKSVLEEMLDQRQQPPNSNIIPSEKLKLVTIGVRDGPESILHPGRALRPWRVIHPSTMDDTKSVTVEPVNAEELIDINPGWRLLRRDPPLIQNEELDRLCRGPHLPSSSEIGGIARIPQDEDEDGSEDGSEDYSEAGSNYSSE